MGHFPLYANGSWSGRCNLPDDPPLGKGTGQLSRSPRPLMQTFSPSHSPLHLQHITRSRIHLPEPGKAGPECLQSTRDKGLLGAPRRVGNRNGTHKVCPSEGLPSGRRREQATALVIVSRFETAQENRLTGLGSFRRMHPRIGVDTV